MIQFQKTNLYVQNLNRLYDFIEKHNVIVWKTALTSLWWRN